MVRGGLVIWAIGHCPGAPTSGGPPPSPKQYEGPQQLSLPGGPEWSQSAPICGIWVCTLFNTMHSLRYNKPIYMQLFHDKFFQ